MSDYYSDYSKNQNSSSKPDGRKYPQSSEFPQGIHLNRNTSSVGNVGSRTERVYTQGANWKNNAASQPIFLEDDKNINKSTSRSNINSELYAQALAAKSNLGLMDNKSSSALESLRNYGSLNTTSPIHSPVRDEFNRNQYPHSRRGGGFGSSFHSASTSHSNFLSPRATDRVSDELSTSNVSVPASASPYKGLKPLINVDITSIDDEDKFLYGEVNTVEDDDIQVISSISKPPSEENKKKASNLAQTKWSDDEDYSDKSKSITYSNKNQYSTKQDEMQIIDMKLNPNAWKDPSVWSDESSKLHKVTPKTKEIVAKFISDPHNSSNVLNKSNIPYQSNFSHNLESSWKDTSGHSMSNYPGNEMKESDQNFNKQLSSPMMQYNNTEHLKIKNIDYDVLNKIDFPTTQLKSNINLKMNDFSMANISNINPKNSEKYSKLQINFESIDKMASKRIVRVRDSFNDVSATSKTADVNKFSNETTGTQRIIRERVDNKSLEENYLVSEKSVEGPALPKQYISDDLKNSKNVKDNSGKKFPNEKNYPFAIKTNLHKKQSEYKYNTHYKHISPTDHSQRRRSRGKSPPYQSRHPNSKYYGLENPDHFYHDRSNKYYSRERSPRRRSRDRRDRFSPRKRSCSRYRRSRSRSPKYYHRSPGSRSPKNSPATTPHRYPLSERSGRHSFERSLSNDSLEFLSLDDNSSLSSSDSFKSRGKKIKEKLDPKTERQFKNKILDIDKETSLTLAPDLPEKNVARDYVKKTAPRNVIPPIHTSKIFESDTFKPSQVKEKKLEKTEKNVEEVVEMRKVLENQKILNDIIEGTKHPTTQNRSLSKTVNDLNPSFPNMSAVPQQSVVHPLTPTFSQSLSYRNTFNLPQPPSYMPHQPNYQFPPSFPPPIISTSAQYNFPVPQSASYNAFSISDSNVPLPIKRQTGRVCSLKSVPVSNMPSQISVIDPGKRSAFNDGAENYIKEIEQNKKSSLKSTASSEKLNVTKTTFSSAKPTTSSSKTISGRQLTPVKKTFSKGNYEQIGKDDEINKEKYKELLYDRHILQKTLKNTSNDTAEIRNYLTDLEKKNSLSNNDKIFTKKFRNLLEKAQEELKYLIDNAKDKNKSLNDLASMMKPDNVKKLQEEFEEQVNDRNFPLHKSSASGTYAAFEGGQNWCDHCCKEFNNIGQLLTHLYSPEHLERVDPKNPVAFKEPKKESSGVEGVILRHIKGVEFIKPHYSFYCSLCFESLLNESYVQQHLKGHNHTVNYMEFLKENPIYEKKRELIRGAKINQMVKAKIKKDLVEKELNKAKRQKIEADADKKIKDRIRDESLKEKIVEELEEDENTDSNDSPKKTSNIKLTLVKAQDSKKESESKPKERLIYIGQMPSYRSRVKFNEKLSLLKSKASKEIAKSVEKEDNTSSSELNEGINIVTKDKKSVSSSKSSDSIPSNTTEKSNQDSIMKSTSDSDSVPKIVSKKRKIVVSGCQSESEANILNIKEQQNNLSKGSSIKAKSDISESVSNLDTSFNKIINPKIPISSISLPINDSSKIKPQSIPVIGSNKNPKKPKLLSEEEKDFLLLGINKDDMMPLVIPRPPPASLIQDPENFSQNKAHIDALKVNLPPFPPPLQVPPPEIKITPSIPPFPPPLQVPPPDLSMKSHLISPDNFSMKSNHPPLPPPIQVPPPNLRHQLDINSYSPATIYTSISVSSETDQSYLHDEITVVDMDIDPEDFDSSGNVEIISSIRKSTLKQIEICTTDYSKTSSTKSNHSSVEIKSANEKGVSKILPTKGMKLQLKEAENVPSCEISSALLIKKSQKNYLKSSSIEESNKNSLKSSSEIPSTDENSIQSTSVPLNDNQVSEKNPSPAGKSFQTTTSDHKIDYEEYVRTCSNVLSSIMNTVTKSVAGDKLNLVEVDPKELSSADSSSRVLNEDAYEITAHLQQKSTENIPDTPVSIVTDNEKSEKDASSQDNHESCSSITPLLVNEEVADEGEKSYSKARTLSDRISLKESDTALKHISETDIDDKLPEDKNAIPDYEDPESKELLNANVRTTSIINNETLCDTIKLISTTHSTEENVSVENMSKVLGTITELGHDAVTNKENKACAEISNEPTELPLNDGPKCVENLSKTKQNCLSKKDSELTQKTISNVTINNNVECTSKEYFVEKSVCGVQLSEDKINECIQDSIVENTEKHKNTSDVVEKECKEAITISSGALQDTNKIIFEVTETNILEDSKDIDIKHHLEEKIDVDNCNILQDEKAKADKMLDTESFQDTNKTIFDEEETKLVKDNKDTDIKHDLEEKNDLNNFTILRDQNIKFDEKTNAGKIIKTSDITTKTPISSQDTTNKTIFEIEETNLVKDNKDIDIEHHLEEKIGILRDQNIEFDEKTKANKIISTFNITAKIQTLSQENCQKVDCLKMVEEGMNLNTDDVNNMADHEKDITFSEGDNHEHTEKIFCQIQTFSSDLNLKEIKDEEKTEAKDKTEEKDKCADKDGIERIYKIEDREKFETKTEIKYKVEKNIKEEEKAKDDQKIQDDGERNDGLKQSLVADVCMKTVDDDIALIYDPYSNLGNSSSLIESESMLMDTIASYSQLNKSLETLQSEEVTMDIVQKEEGKISERETQVDEITLDDSDTDEYDTEI